MFVCLYFEMQLLHSQITGLLSFNYTLSKYDIFYQHLFEYIGHGFNNVAMLTIRQAG